jgi:hypothetical protein
MDHLGSPDRGGSARAGESTPLVGPAGHTLERPARLAEGDLVEAVSHAVLRELEGGFVAAQTPVAVIGHTMGIRPIDPIKVFNTF